METQILLNSVVFVLLMVRFASQMCSRSGAWKLAVFISTVLLANLALMNGRFGFEVSFYKSVMIAFGFLVGTTVMAYAKRGEKK